MPLTPDLIARVHLYTAEEDGRSKTITATQFRTVFCFEGENFDCRFLLDQTGQVLAPGVTAAIPIKFLFPQLIKPRLHIGATFKLWDLRIFADGEVIEIIE